MRYLKNPENLRYSLNIVIPLLVFLTSILASVIAVRTHDMDAEHFLLWIFGVSSFTAFCSFIIIFAMTQPIKELIEKVEKVIRFEKAGKTKGQMMEVYRLIERLMELVRLERSEGEKGGSDIKRELERLDYIVPLGYMSLMVAHEVRNPLNTITGMSELLKGKLEGSKANLYVDTILDSAKKIDDFTKELLDFTDDSIEKAEFDINSVIRESINNLEIQFHDVRCDFNAEDHISFEGDKNKIYQALNNIIKNAFEYEKDSGYVRITTKMDNAIEISVFNQNSVVPEEEKENIFKPFYTKRKGGKGIGLFIAMRNIKLHGGDIKVESGEKGTTFIVQLPKHDNING